MSVLTKLTEDVNSLGHLSMVHTNIFQSNSFQELIIIMRKTFREALEINYKQMKEVHPKFSRKEPWKLLNEIKECLHFLTSKLGKVTFSQIL
jgi:hypothetical protein